MGMAAGRAAAAAAMVASAAAVLLLAGGAYADCYDDCFKDCMSRMNQRDYCSYACDKVCTPDAADDATLQRPRPLAVVWPAAALADPDHRPLDKKPQDAVAVRPAALLDHLFHETHGGGGVKPAGEPDPGRVARPARVPVLP